MIRLALTGLALRAAVQPALAWSGPTVISNPSDQARTTPRLTRGVGGNLYLVYVEGDDVTTSAIYFREQSSEGTWEEPAVQLGTAAFSTRPDVVEVLPGEPHVVAAVKNPTGHDLYHFYRQSAVWTGGFVAATSDVEDHPRLAADELHRVHMVYTRGAVEGSSADVIYRVWMPDCPVPPCNGWSAETLLGQVGNAFNHRPDITVDAAGTVHVVWVQQMSGNYRVRYARNVGGIWQATINIGSGSAILVPPDVLPPHSFRFPRIARAGAGQIAVVWHDTTSNGSSNLRWNYSTTSGALWAFPFVGVDRGEILHNGDHPQLESGIDGSAHLVSQGAGESVLLYRQWTGGPTWSDPEVIVAGAAAKTWADIAQDAGGDLHTVWDEEFGPNEADHHIAYSFQPLNPSPDPLVTFTATAYDGMVRLNWLTPSDPGLSGLVIRFSTSNFPGDPGAGQSLADLAVTPDTPGTLDHTGLTNGVTVYYSAFTYNTGLLYSSVTNVSATPAEFILDHDDDADVDQTDFANLQTCLGDPTPPGCVWADFNSDNRVNSADAETLVDCMRGANTDYDPSCLD